MMIDVTALNEKLCEAQRIFNESKKPEGDEDAKHLAAMVVMEAITNLVYQANSNPIKVLEPIDWMMNEFMRKVYSDPVKHQKPQYDAVRMGIASGAVDLLMREGLKREDAARRVCRQSQVSTPEALIEFRKNIGKGKVVEIATEAKIGFVNEVKIRLKDIESPDLRKKAILKSVKILSYR